MKPLKDVLQVCRNSFDSGVTRDVNFVEKQLRCLELLLEENESKLHEALMKDLRKGKVESETSEIISIRNDLRLALKQFKGWSNPETVEKNCLLNVLDKLRIYKDPYGVVLIICPWNYPLRLTFLPLIGAIAAGNCVVVKPSELAPASESLIAELLPRYLDNECYQVVTGGVKETTELLQHRFDYVFFTGGSSVGKIVREATNKFLTPVTLELGGKCPVFLDEQADVEVAARRILWGKFYNCGQTCIAPDYLLCSPEVQKKFLAVCAKIIDEFYGADPKQSKDLCRIINKSHFERVKKLVDQKKVYLGGDFDEDQLYISPTILVNVDANDAVMQEEIFGPLLPIITLNSAEEAIQFINSREKPLALYVFSTDKKCVEKFLKATSSGGVTINDTLLQIVSGNLPFGGVGCSGMGAYQGKATFDTFVHKKSVLMKDLRWLGEKVGAIRYPPYNETKSAFLKVFCRQSYCKYRKYFGLIFMFGLGVFTAQAMRCIKNKYES